MGKDAKSNEPHPDLERVEQLAELFDEDHLEFEEALLDIKQRLESLSTTVKHISRRIDDLAAEIDDSRQVQTGMDAKIDQLRVSMAELMQRVQTTGGE
ncbi:MAG: hypothetical protein GF341_05130 [candidate division Zixibacteria bacterium]|nr:hypothetical protein [candidate division Zixibacteria bacterium]